MKLELVGKDKSSRTQAGAVWRVWVTSSLIGLEKSLNFILCIIRIKKI